MCRTLNALLLRQLDCTDSPVGIERDGNHLLALRGVQVSTLFRIGPPRPSPSVGYLMFI
jgi:hypothetical protein